MNTTKKLVLAGLAIASISGAGLFSQNVFAQSADDTSTLASKIAHKFNLQETEVRAVLEQYRLDKQAEREAKFTEELEQAVHDKKLTTEQKDKITAKRQEIKTKLAAIKDITDKEEIKKAHKQLQIDTQAWAKDNNIPLRWLRASGHAKHLLQKENDSQSKQQ